MELFSWWRVAVLLALLGMQLASCDPGYANYDYNDADVDLTDNYDDEAVYTSPALDALTRVRRYDSSKEVEDMLKQMFLDQNVQFPTRIKVAYPYPVQKFSREQAMMPDNYRGTKMDRALTEDSNPKSNLKDTKSPTRSSVAEYRRDMLLSATATAPYNVGTTLMINNDNVADESTSETSSILMTTEEPTSNVEELMVKLRTSHTEEQNTTQDPTVTTPSDPKRTLVMSYDDVTGENTLETSTELLTDTDETTSNIEELIMKLRESHTEDSQDIRLRASPSPLINTTVIYTRAVFDLGYLLRLVTNLTDEYEGNLTRRLNESLWNYTIPSCPPTETTKPLPDYSQDNMTIIGKCFVCGLDIPMIPEFARCSDAFASDFVPLPPVDNQAKGFIASYRKYCRYRDVNHYVLNSSQPRSIFGRWTGGCAVRWVDLSGIYTQRTCRNRAHPVLGMHYTSKRMAKLELALTEVDNGCIVSPMATLVPFSRGISLYARFHACVCTGSWCNVCVRHRPSILRVAFIMIFIIHYLFT